MEDVNMSIDQYIYYYPSDGSMSSKLIFYLYRYFFSLCIFLVGYILIMILYFDKFESKLIPALVALPLLVLFQYFAYKHLYLAIATTKGLFFKKSIFVTWEDILWINYWPSLFIYIGRSRKGFVFLFPIDSPFRRKAVNQSIADRIDNYHQRFKKGSVASGIR